MHAISNSYITGTRDARDITIYILWALATMDTEKKKKEQLILVVSV